jgi:putative colanic acid biosynthesis acetyltransferase WcaF
MNKVELDKFTGDEFDKGAGFIKQMLWYFINAFFVRASWNPFMGIKIFLLKLFGAKIGKGLVIKNNVIIKFPWKLEIGDHCWIGENVWIDNLDVVKIGHNVCVSQGAMLLTGNHDYTVYNMPFRNSPIILMDGVWIGAKTVVCPGVIAEENSILTAGSVIVGKMLQNKIYQGNLAKMVKNRFIN